MIKSAKKEKYYGTLAYADGEIRKVISHVKEVTEDSDGIKHSEYWILKNFGYVSKIVSVEAYKIMTALDTVTAVVKVDGRTYIGHAQCNPSDQFDGAFGRKLALARAMLKEANIYILDEAFSAIDKNLKETIKDSLISKLRDKTVIVVSHQLKNFEQFDRVYEIRGKRLNCIYSHE
jgi:ABC-type multidrug transport system ATPase subunit